MYCGECGAQNPDTNQFCRNCGKPLKKRQQVPAAPPAATPVPPVGQAPALTVSGPQPAPAGAVPLKNTGMRVMGFLSVIAGLGAFILYPYLLGGLALVFGGISVWGTRKKTGEIAYIAVIGIVAGLAAILSDNFYFLLFPPKEITFDLITFMVVS